MGRGTTGLGDRFSVLAKLYQRYLKGGNSVRSNLVPVPQAPALAPSTAAALSILFTLLYVVPFYLSSLTRPSPQLHRDAPPSIRARVRAVTVSSLACLAITVYVLRQHGHASLWDILKLLGWWPISLIDTARTMLLMSILFAGPLFEAGIVEGEIKHWIHPSHLLDSLSSWVGYRNYVAGPVSEELIWRGMIIPLHILANFSGKQIIFLTPLYFGIAHVHHLYDFRVTNPTVPLALGIARSLFQFAYTSLFGFIASFIFVRTGNIFSVILAHSFCNWMGLPRFWGRVGVEAGVPIGPPDARGKDDTDAVPKTVPSGESKGIAWTVAYYIILVGGAYGFYRGLFPLTESAYALPVVLVEK
ncbi:CaaX prenyl protein-like proteinase Rce1 [Westerdykella ornata]|uniref:intramembrane prenyl-peptidase Rce1 n=1 Tax=Westerdykella ornata TaxID=318751 RepID=A0A6A6JWH2_WESOR|nr:CaaX prenyl protein-like proteinase Rce1 [Westerdykella ornata]KAF2280433.1 CaaX prenyl protein-like proteinase Rce1 [Westerdykella ornata]